VRHGWVNRNRLPNGTWLTAPVDEHDTYAPINRVHLARDPVRWREKMGRSLAQYLGDYTAQPYRWILERRRHELLVGLNAALLEQLFRDLEITTRWIWQSHLAAGRHWGPVVGDDPWELTPVSEKLAAMTAELGGDVWLSGSSGRHYLDERPFAERDITVDYFEWDGPNDSAVGELARVAA